MHEDTLTVRELDIRTLEPFCRALAQILHQAGLGQEQVLAAMRDSIEGECLRCNLRISGEELFALSQPPGDLSTAKIGRMRLGDCAREGCDSFFYRLDFHSRGTLNWPRLLAQAEATRHEQTLPSDIGKRSSLQLGLTWIPRRIWLGLALLLLLLLLRQWFLGGPIPLIREPEHFHVTPASEE